MGCYTKILEDERRTIFRKFWKLGDHNKHMDFLSKHVRKEKKSETVRQKKLSTPVYNELLFYNQRIRY